MFGGNAPSLADIAAVTGKNGDGDGFGGNNGWWILIILFALFGWGGRGNFGGSGGNGDSGSNGGGGTTVVTVPMPTCSGGYGFSGGVGNGFIDAAIQRGFDNQAVISKLDGINSGICSLGYDQLAQMNGINSNIMQTGFGLQNSIQQSTVTSMQDNFALSRQLAQCCCNIEALLAAANAARQADTCAITTAINQAAQNIMQNDNCNYRQLHDEQVAIQMQAKDDKIAEQSNTINALNLAQSQANQNLNLLGAIQKMLNNDGCCGNNNYSFA